MAIITRRRMPISGKLVGSRSSSADRKAALSHGFDPSAYVEPADIAEHLDLTDWEIELFDTSGPSSESSNESHNTDDVTLKAKRRN